ncbi:MAG: Flp family type IVb pilin, partial [Alphaproteobacteria bacterium]|nr:Flp family type IVb pilin [Alphaproteobacteria bacterium]
MLARLIRTFLRSQDGNTAIEYGLFTALIGVTIIVQVGLMGEALEAIFEGPVAAMDMAN